MDIAVGVGRPVVQDKSFLALGFIADLKIKAVLVPLFQKRGLALNEVGLHRKIRLRQIEGFLVIHDYLIYFPISIAKSFFFLAGMSLGLVTMANFKASWALKAFNFPIFGTAAFKILFAFSAFLVKY